MRKIISSISNGITTEHQGKSFNEIYSFYKGQDVILVLTRYDENGMGYIYHSEAIIGNCLNELTIEDYYIAYDKII